MKADESEVLEHTGAEPENCLQHNQVLISWDLEFEDLNGRIVVTLLQGLILTPTGRTGCKTTPGCQHFTIISIALCESSGAPTPPAAARSQDISLQNTNKAGPD